MMSFSIRKAIKQRKVSVRLCHLILYSDGTHEWEINLLFILVQPSGFGVLIFLHFTI